MTTTEDIKLEGVTTFPGLPETSYRYSIELKNSKMSIWMEDRRSKKQWYNGGMAKTTVVSPGNEIPNASASDYAKCFQDLLNCDLDSSKNVHRKLTMLENGSIRLNLSMEVVFFRTTWVHKFAFDLDPVSVKQIDVLQSKLHDQQDALERLEKRFEQVQTDQSTIFIQLKASTKDKNSNLLWGKSESVSFNVNEENGVVKMARAGAYIINGIVSCGNDESEQKVMLLKNEDCIQTNFGECNETIPFVCVERLKKMTFSRSRATAPLMVLHICQSCVWGADFVFQR